jgi:hypothetical protein
MKLEQTDPIPTLALHTYEVERVRMRRCAQHAPLCMWFELSLTVQGSQTLCVKVGVFVGGNFTQQ